jgi:hypothetical protein
MAFNFFSWIRPIILVAREAQCLADKQKKVKQDAKENLVAMWQPEITGVTGPP